MVIGELKMTFQEKIKNSTIIDERLQKKNRRIKDKKSRLKSILLTAIIVVYTLIITITKIMKLNKEEFFNNFGTDELLILLSFVLLTFKIIFSIIISCTKKSLFQLNHLTFYSIVDACNVLVLAGLFFINIYNYSSILDLSTNWKNNNTFMQNITNLMLKDFFHSCLFYMTIIINIPVLFKFFIFSVTNGAILYISFITAVLSPIMVLCYLKRTNRIFFEYTEYDNKYYLIRRRYINKFGYGFSRFIVKLVIVAVIFTINYFLFKSSFESVGVNAKTIQVVTYIMPAYVTGYLISLIYLYKRKMENKVYSKCQDQLYSAESKEKVERRENTNKRLDEYANNQDPNRFEKN